MARKSLDQLTTRDLKRFANHLAEKPNKRGDGRSNRATIVKLLGHIRGFTAWAKGAGLIKVDPGLDVRPRDKTAEERSRTAARRAFRTDELVRLFNSPVLTGCQNSYWRGRPGPRLTRDEKWWFWPLALLTGGRCEELAEAPATLGDFGGIKCIWMPGTKSTNAPRWVPVLPDLERLGFYAWAERQRRLGRGLVQGPEAAGDWSKWANRYLATIGLKGEEDTDLVLHSARHSFSQMCRAGGLGDELKHKIMGHADEDNEDDGGPRKRNKGGRNKGRRNNVGALYGKELSPGEARRVYDNVKSPIPLEHLWQLTPRD